MFSYGVKGRGSQEVLAITESMYGEEDLSWINENLIAWIFQKHMVTP